MAIGTLNTATVTGSSKDNSRQFRSIFPRIIFARLSVAEASLGAGLSSSAAFTVAGVKQGDMVLVSAVSDWGDDILFAAAATAADEVTVTLTDLTEAANTSAAVAGEVNIVVLGVEDNEFDAAGSY